MVTGLQLDEVTINNPIKHSEHPQDTPTEVVTPTLPPSACLLKMNNKMCDITLNQKTQYFGYKKINVTDIHTL